MANPIIPHLMGVTLDSNGVANTQVIAFNRNTGKYQKRRTNGDKVVIFDAADFVSAYTALDVIEFQNVGASTGMGTITISDAVGGFQEVTLTCTAASTYSMNL